MSTPLLTEQYVCVVKEWLRQHGYNPYRLAREMEASPGMFRDIFRPDWNPKLSTLDQPERFIRSRDPTVRFP